MSVKKIYSYGANGFFPANKDPLNRVFDWGSAPEHLTKYKENAQAKAFIEDVIRTAVMTKAESRQYGNVGIPEKYKRHYKLLLAHCKKLNANPAALTIEQLLARDRHFHRTYRNFTPLAGMLDRFGSTFFLDQKAWDLKSHTITDYNYPQFTNDFIHLGSIDVGIEGVKHTGRGWGMLEEISFARLDMARGGIYDPDFWYAFKLAEKMGIFTDERLALGGSGENTTGAGAPNLTGLYNTASKATIVPGDDDDNNMTVGIADWNDLMIKLLGSTFSNAVFAPGVSNVLVTTSGLAAEMYFNDNAVGETKSLYQRFKEKWVMSGALTAWYIDNNIEADANATNTQKLMFLKLGPNYIRRYVVYPLQRKARLDKVYSDDLKMAFITGDILVRYDANAIVTDDADNTTTHAGIMTNGLFMDASTGRMAPAAPGIRSV
ncbi:hypothetical protein LCGC14_0531410 [marine sediment metagenome]|uniref:Uncharacterized protein n=1 Tax=marine sediment metagenome TaxID=412755 RepID=A0A0F9RVL8_9ZZZZ